MKYRIVPNGTDTVAVVEASNAEEAMVDFAQTMDLDMNAYFKAVEEPEGDNPYYDIVLKVRTGFEGLTPAELIDLIGMLDSNEMYPIEINEDLTLTSAMGFITVNAAERMGYKYGQESEIGSAIQHFLRILNDGNSEDGVRRYSDFNIWLSR